MKNEVVHIRLLNGDELVGQIMDQTKSSLTVRNPLSVEIHDEEAGRVVVLVKYSPYAKIPMITLQKKHILTSQAVHEEMVRHYVLSLRLAGRADRYTVESLRAINKVMEQALMTNRPPSG